MDKSRELVGSPAERCRPSLYLGAASLSMTSLSIEVFGAPYTVVNGLVNVPRCGKLHLYAQKKKPELETAIEMQKRIEEDTVDAQRIKVRRLFCACTRSSTPALSHVVPCLAGQFSSGPRSRGAQHALAPWGYEHRRTAGDADMRVDKSIEFQLVLH